MIAKWIAQALLAKKTKEYMTLNKVQLASWYIQGSRVDNGSPYNSLGAFSVAHLGRIRTELEQKLQSIEVPHWPTGLFRDWTIKSSRLSHFPRLEATRVGPDSWAVPIIPEDPGHSLDAWSFSLSLTTEETIALRPVAVILATRCLLTSYCKTSETRNEHPVPWDISRIHLALMAGITIPQLQAGFVVAKAQTSSAKSRCAPVNLALLRAPLRPLA